MKLAAARRWVRKWAVSIVCCVVIVITAFVSAWQWTRATSDGAVHVGKPVATATKPPSNEPVPLTTAYFTTVLPHGFVVKRQTENSSSPALLELVANDQHQQFAVTVRSLPVGGLSGVGDYNLRVTQTTSYQPYRPAGLPVESTAFRSLAGPPAFVVFWPHGAQYAEVALTSDGVATSGQLFNTFVQAAHQWQWK